MTAPLTPEREALIRSWATTSFSDNAAAEARGREAGLREAVVACDRIIASEPLSAYANLAHCCRAAILSLIGTPPPPQGGSDGR